MIPINFVPENLNIDFVRLRKISFAASVLLMLVSIVYSLIFGFNFGIDFAGGITIEARSDLEADLPEMRRKLSNLEIGEVVIQNFGSKNDISIRVGSKNGVDLTKNVELIQSEINKSFPYKIEYRNVSFVGPQVGNEMIKSGAIAMVLCFMSIMLYIWVRFEWYFGFGVLVSLIHDVILCLGFMSFFWYDFNLSTVAAILTVIGYSVNDSVVIYDRIRENIRKYHNKTISEIVNMSTNETLSRTTITVLTTLLANLALILFGGKAIESFSILVFFGVVVGTYSSIFISAPILTMFTVLQGKKQSIPQQ